MFFSRAASSWPSSTRCSRGTADVDFTTDLQPSPRAARGSCGRRSTTPCRVRRHGSVILIWRCGYRRVKRTSAQVRQPSDNAFPVRLDVKVAYGCCGSGERRLAGGQAPHVVDLEVGFNEPIHAIEVIRLGVNGPSFAAYALTDLLAEKFRALLQQVARNRTGSSAYIGGGCTTSPIWRRNSRQTMMSGLRYSNPSATSAGRVGSHRRPKLGAILGSRSARRPNGIPSGKKLASYRTSMRASPKSRRSTVRCPGQAETSLPNRPDNYDQSFSDSASRTSLATRVFGRRSRKRMRPYPAMPGRRERSNGRSASSSRSAAASPVASRLVRSPSRPAVPWWLPPVST